MKVELSYIRKRILELNEYNSRENWLKEKFDLLELELKTEGDKKCQKE